MQRTTLAMVWHMHQPYYRDMVTGESTMPWVRLHGIHSYYDMIRLYEKFPGVSGTINFVPSLVEQLLAYTEGGQSDAFLDHTLVPAEDLSAPQKMFLLRHFFMANPEQKIAPYGNYNKLHQRRGLDPSRIDFQQAIRFFSTQDYLDLQVFYNLVWFGFAAKEEIPEIREMLARGGHFTEGDKTFVVDAQRRILKELLVGLRRAAASTNVEICTTPYYHPILPLLIDNGIALRANPRAPMPPSLKMPGMAKYQLKRALESMERWTGKRPAGMWPAEGSVCPEMIPMLAEAGVKWIATDNRVLAKSLSRDEKDVDFCQPFAAEHDGKTVNMVFRDYGISDLISFTYSKMPAQVAVDDFLKHVSTFDMDPRKGDRLVTVILDGENPWEFYPDSGKGFLTALFSAFEREKVPTSTVSGYIERHPPTKVLKHLHSGSWIDANFDIWIGKPQKNVGWSYIKRALDEIGDALSEGDRGQSEKARRAFESFAAACGSDWFWWYDDDFDSAFKPDFDRIFRQHLKNAFAFLGLDIPLFLFEPIYRFQTTAFDVAEPAGFMYPQIDGLRTSFFEWANAIRYNVRGRGGAMAVASELLETISFGFNTKAFFLRLDPVDTETGFALSEEEKLIFYIHDGNRHYKFAFTKKPDGFHIDSLSENMTPVAPECIRWALGSVLEIAFGMEALGFHPGERITVAVAINRLGVEVRRYSHIHFAVPDESYEQKMWSV